MPVEYTWLAAGAACLARCPEKVAGNDVAALNRAGGSLPLAALDPRHRGRIRYGIRSPGTVAHRPYSGSYQ